MTVASRSAASKIEAVSDVVVVFPWVPAMAIPERKRISSASISARAITGIFRFFAAIISGLSSLMAGGRTTT